MSLIWRSFQIIQLFTIQWRIAKDTLFFIYNVIIILGIMQEEMEEEEEEAKIR